MQSRRFTFFCYALLLYCCSVGYWNNSHATVLHMAIADPMLGIRDLAYELIDGYAVTEGDILIKKIMPKSSPTMEAVIILKLGGARWPQGLIPYSLDKSLPNITKLAILDAITIWQQQTHLQFVEITLQNQNLYPDYLLFIPTDNNTCSSFVGKQGGAQVVKLSMHCKTMNIAHEIGHAAGLWHEQSRHDRDAYIQINWENIEEQYRYNFDQHLTDGQDFGEYDYQSIMHYTAYAFSKNGQKTIVPLQSNVEIGQRQHLSHKDIAAVNAMYPKQ